MAQTKSAPKEQTATEQLQTDKLYETIRTYLL